ncbi:MAG: hypothetical protein JW809_18450 [Pirellulales bacterium]|nr:hypothetical protein [Pirellulales bacterium]
MNASATLLPENARAGQLLVCERAGRWAAAIRREWKGQCALVPTENLDACWRRLAEAPSSFVAVELTAENLDPLIERLSQLSRAYPLARVAVVGQSEATEHQWLLREAGAVHVVASRRHAGGLARLARRHLDRAPQPPKDAITQIRSRLPWRPSDQPQSF